MEKLEMWDERDDWMMTLKGQEEVGGSALGAALGIYCCVTNYPKI